jgi:hypothetical protein
VLIQLLKSNPLFQRMNAAPNGRGVNQPLFPPKAPAPKAPAVVNKPSNPPKAPAAMTKSISTPNLAPSAPAPAQSITIAGTATSCVILSNLAPTVSVEDVKATLAGIGGGVKEVHIMSHGNSGQGLQVKVAFGKPAEGGRECIARFNGVVADGMTLGVSNDRTKDFCGVRDEFFESEGCGTGADCRCSAYSKGTTTSEEGVFGAGESTDGEDGYAGWSTL